MSKTKNRPRFDLDHARRMGCTTIIGIDPGVNTGIAVYSRQKREIEQTFTLDFWGTIDFLKSFSSTTTYVVIEDPGLNPPTFREHGDIGREKISQNVGSNKAESRLLIDGIRRMGFSVVTVRPNSAKWDAQSFRRITGFTGRCSQHARDAGKLVYGL